MASTMTGMTLDCQKHHTQTTLTTSLGKTGSRKHSLSDVQPPNDKNSYGMTSSCQQNDFLTVFPNAFPKNPPNDILPRFNTEYILHTLPLSLLIPAPFPSEGSIVQKKAKLKTLLKRQQACLKHIPHRLFQAYATLILPNAEAIHALHCIQFAALHQDYIAHNWRHDPLDTK